MKKADYSLLASIIKIEIEKGGIFAQTASNIARSFAQKAQVDKLAFLNACGIK